MKHNGHAIRSVFHRGWSDPAGESRDGKAVYYVCPKDDFSEVKEVLGLEATRAVMQKLDAERQPTLFDHE